MGCDTIFFLTHGTWSWLIDMLQTFITTSTNNLFTLLVVFGFVVSRIEFVFKELKDSKFDILHVYGNMIEFMVNDELERKIRSIENLS